MKKIILLSTVFICCLQFNFAQHPGDLDSSFGTKGLVNTGLLTDNYTASLVVQNDGKIITGGYGLARYNMDGSPDKTFGINGIQAADYLFSSIAIQGDGKIVTLGKLASKVNLLRYNVNGGLDSTFSADGILPTN